MKRPSDEQLLEIYKRHGSCWRAGPELGISASNVRTRLSRLGAINTPHMKQEDLEKIRALYKCGFKRADGKLKALAESLGRTNQSIRIHAWRMKITNSSRAWDDEFVSNKLSKYQGFLGKKQTETSIKKQLETRMKLYGTLCPPLVGKQYKQGWREVSGKRIYFRSRWEANYGRYLEWMKCNNLITSWEHEPQTFWFEGIKRGCMTYLPDFKVTNTDGTTYWVEVKGWMDPRSKTKIRRFRKYYPNETLVVVDSKWYKSNKLKLQFLVPEWESDGPQKLPL